MEVEAIQVVCRAQRVTGGPESLHNLVRQARALNLPAQIVYHPFEQEHAVPSPYRKYEVPVGRLRDEPGVLIVFPETLCMQALQIRRATAAIWWLSVDNFSLAEHRGWRDHLRYARRALRGKRPMRGVRGLRRLLHLSKADYDAAYLGARGIEHLPLCGPISEFFLQRCTPEDDALRQDLILYNPRKDQGVVTRLQRLCPDLRFLALSDLDEAGLRHAYLSAKLYVDFGNHPGKERMPREAAASGCCVITGRRGSAASAVDMPIPERFKIDDGGPDFVGRFRSAVDEVFVNFERVSAEFEGYRRAIFDEPARQLRDLQRIVERLR